MHDVVILGGGPGGYAAALYAHNFGLSVALVERDKVGGTCLHRGCIPAKSWLQAAEVYTSARDGEEFGVITKGLDFDWKTALGRKQKVVDQLHKGLSGLLRQRNVEIIEGTGKVRDARTIEVETPEGKAEVEGEHLIIATGSVPRTIPGYEPDGERIVNSDHALEWTERPERVGIIGAGAIGSEFASLLIDLGSEVHLFELMDQVVPGTDPDAARVLEKALSKRGVQVRTGVEVGQPEMGDGTVRVPFGGESVEADVVLVAVGRAPVTDGIGLEDIKASVDQGFVQVDLTTMETGEPGVYAVGDVVAGTPQLAHAGFAEGIAAITHIATGEVAPVTYRAVPLVVYTHPELAAVGLTEAQAEEEGYQVEVSKHSLAGVGRAIIVGQTEGIVKVVSEKDGPILGASVVGPSAGELIHELMYSVGWEAYPAEAAAFIHAHPTLSEAVGETLLSASGRSLH